jgi:Caspase domain
MARRALLVGIDDYHGVPALAGCVADAQAMADMLSTNDDGGPNFHCRLLTAPRSEVTRAALRAKWEALFGSFDGDVLFYFSGHGLATTVGGYLVTQEGTPQDPGLPMNDLLLLANQSKARSVLLILDCCYSGSLGHAPVLQPDGSMSPVAQLRAGVTVLAASRPTEVSLEVDGHGVFTGLLLGALAGGAADVRGRVSAASLYAYVEAVLGAWDQRPLYKSYASHLEPVRLCAPAVSDALLRELPQLFDRPGATLVLDPSYEETAPVAVPERVALFRKFKTLRNAGLLATVGGDDLYWAAMRNGAIKLTPLGQFYWRLAETWRI